MTSIVALLIFLLDLFMLASAGQRFKWDSFCHQQAEYPDLVAKLTSTPDDAAEWCVIIPDQIEGGYREDLTSLSDDPKYPHLLDMLKVRELCRKFNAALIDIDLRENTTKSVAVKKALDELERVRDPEWPHEYPIHCAYEFDTKLNKNIPACNKGRLPDDYEYYIVYGHGDYAFPFQLHERTTFTSHATWFKKTFYYVCYQKVNKTETSSGSFGQSHVMQIVIYVVGDRSLLMLICALMTYLVDRSDSYKFYQVSLTVSMVDTALQELSRA